MKTLIQAIIFIAFFLQALIPLGFMPNAKASSQGTALVICSGLDIKTIYVDENGQPLEEDHSALGSSPCPYATLTSFIPTENFVFAQAEAFSLETPVFSCRAQLALNPKFLRPHAIGPPRLI